MATSRYMLISHPLTEESPTYGNRDKFSCDATSLIRNGDTANSSAWHFSSNHIGSHVDMPKHFHDDGKSITDYPADKWFFKHVLLVDIPRLDGTLISPRDLEGFLEPDIELLLIRTGYEGFRAGDQYWNDNPGLEPDLAPFLRKHCPKLRAVGFDFISLSAWRYKAEGKEAHKRFLAESDDFPPIWILEDLALANMSIPIGQVIVAPLFVAGANGSPITVFAEVPE